MHGKGKANHVYLDIIEVVFLVVFLYMIYIYKIYMCIIICILQAA